MKGYTDFNAYCATVSGLSFTDYLTFAQDHIRSVRERAGVGHDPETVAMNAPFEYRPASFDGKRAVLLIHGFLTCPYIMRSLATWYVNQGFLVRAIVLPGHGTVPGELQYATFEHWQQIVNYGIESLKPEASEIHLGGYSLGATLACLASMRHTIKSLTLLSPALGISRSAFLLPIVSKLPLKQTQWLCRLKENDLATYRSIPIFGAWQVLRAIRALHTALYNIQLPCFVVISKEDTTVRAKPVIQYFKYNHNPLSYLRIYSKTKPQYPRPTPRVDVIHSSLLDPQVLDIAHIAIPVAPNDPYYGKQGLQKGVLPEKALFGENSKHNLRQQYFYRLSYNPDFDGMTKKLGEFYKSSLATA